MSLSKKFVVTGGAGFIGSHMVDRLVREGHSVTIVDTLRSGFRANVNAAASLVEADITDTKQLESVFVGAAGVFHFAAIARTPWCIEDPILCYQTNVMGTLNVLEAARRTGVPRVVLSSSNVVCGDFPSRNQRVFAFTDPQISLPYLSPPRSG